MIKWDDYSQYTAIILGVGRMGQRYLGILASLDISVVAISDQNSETLADASRLCPTAKIFRDPQVLFEEISAPIVIIASTAPSHAELTILAAEKGAKYIICEKPMAVSIEEAQMMVQHCKHRSVQLAVNHQMRFMPQYTRAKEIIDSESFGKFCSMNVIAGNFGLTMNGSHYIEALRYLSGEDPLSVCAWLEETGIPNPRGAQFSDQAGRLLIVTPSGIRFYLDCGADQGHGMHALYAGKYGQVAIDEARGVLCAVTRRPEDRMLPTSRVVTEPVITNEILPPAEIIESTKAVICALINGEECCTGEQALVIVRTLVAAYVSNEQCNRPVSIFDDLPTKRIFPWA